MENKSKPYGYYGGVTQENHYVPPPSVPFDPQPASVHFYKEYRTTLSNLISSVGFTQQFLIDNQDSIMVRKLVQQLEGVNHFEINTQGHPNDIIEYDVLSGVDPDLLTLDGGTF
jgi:hypothetical protein